MGSIECRPEVMRSPSPHMPTILRFPLFLPEPAANSNQIPIDVFAQVGCNLTFIGCTLNV